MIKIMMHRITKITRMKRSQGEERESVIFERIIELGPGPDKPMSLYNHHSTSYVMFDITQWYCIIIIVHCIDVHRMWCTIYENPMLLHRHHHLRQLVRLSVGKAFLQTSSYPEGKKDKKFWLLLLLDKIIVLSTPADLQNVANDKLNFSYLLNQIYQGTNTKYKRQPDLSTCKYEIQKASRCINK